MLTEDQSKATYQIQSISSHKIIINNKSYTSSLIISSNQLIYPWNPASTDTLTDQDLLIFLELKPDIILLGTGEKSIILPPFRLARLLEKNLSVECMSTPAACRTYTVLAAEGRNVAAGLIL